MLVKGSQEQFFFFLQTLLFTPFLATVQKIITYALVSTWSLVISGWEHVKRIMHHCQQPVNHYLSNLSAGDVFHSYIAELSTTSNWGDRGREKSRKPQLFTALFFLLLYSPLLLQIINSTGNNWVDPPITYHPDPATLRSCGIASLCSGWVGFALQILLPKILLLHS